MIVAGNVLWAYYAYRLNAKSMLAMCIASVILNGDILATAIAVQKPWECGIDGACRRHRALLASLPGPTDCHEGAERLSRPSRVTIPRAK
jgi:hypothetical protein